MCISNLCPHRGSPNLLPACVGIWTSVVDDEAVAVAGQDGIVGAPKSVALRGVKERCRETMAVLGGVSDPALWRDAKATLLEAEPDLEGLYEY